MGNTGTPWSGDATSLVDAFRSGERSPLEELEASLAAVAASKLNSVCFVDEEAARDAARSADVSLPFGGVPLAVKELDAVAGWPDTHASVPFADEIADQTSTMVTRLRAAGAVTAVQTTSSEFGGVNQTNTKLHGATRNPWNPERTPGGSSGGSAAAVAGGLVAIATAGDGGGSIRIPAGFTGLLGLKCTWGRIPRGPKVGPGNLTAVPGCVSRSVRDTARWFDVVNGFDLHDPLSLPRVDGWEAGLGSHLADLRGRRALVTPDLGGLAVVADEVAALVTEAAEWLLDGAGLVRREAAVNIPRMGAAWAVTGQVGLVRTLGDRWPDCAPELTGLMRIAAQHAHDHFDVDAAARAERRRIDLNEAMAALFDEVDLVITATNPDVAFTADGHLPGIVDGREVRGGNHGALTIPSNIYGNPAISIPIGTSSEGLPVGLQVLAPHHREKWLLDLALLVERERPWPLVAPGAPS